MLEPTPTEGRLIAFRLADIPLDVRVRALASITRPKEFELLMATFAPSERVYRISEAAWELVMKSPQTAHTFGRPVVSWPERPG